MYPLQRLGRKGLTLQLQSKGVVSTNLCSEAIYIVKLITVFWSISPHFTFHTNRTAVQKYGNHHGNHGKHVTPVAATCRSLPWNTRRPSKNHGFTSGAGVHDFVLRYLLNKTWVSCLVGLLVLVGWFNWVMLGGMVQG